MDRTEGALLVAETALREARALAKEVEALKAAPKGAVSFLVNESGELVAVFADGQSKSVGRVRGEDGTPGACVLSASIDDGGQLTFAMSDGRNISAGLARGQPGKDGEQGRDAAAIQILDSIDESKSYPRGTFSRHLNGFWYAAAKTNGMRGWECLVAGIADLKIELPEERKMVVTAMLSNGEQVTKEIFLAHPIDRGIHRHDSEYLKGDGVTWAGSWWIAQVDKPTDKPGISDQWRLAVKRGRDGKDKE